MWHGVRARLKASRLDRRESEALRSVLDHPKLEVLPLKNLADQLRYIPEEATVTVTASPTKGQDATVDLAIDLKQNGLDVIPHLSARMIEHENDLKRILDSLAKAGISRVFVVGGDAQSQGQFPDGLALLKAMDDLGHPFAEIGVPCYPEGHPAIPEATLMQDLAQKQQFADYMTTQMCFDPAVISNWISAARAEGIRLPVHIGLPGVAPLHKLISISARIGIGDSVRFLSHNTGLVRRLLRPTGYAPDNLVLGLAPTISDQEAQVEAFHIYTFNQVATTEAWRRRLLSYL